MPTVRFAGTPTTTNVSEGAGLLTHQLVLSAPSTQVVTVTVTGPGYRQGDMDVSAQTITFQPGQTTATWQVAITDDAIYEGNEVFGFEITSASGADIDRTQGVSQFLGYIIDNDLPTLPTVRFAGPPTTTNVSEGAGYLTHQLVLSAPSAQVVTVTVAGPGYRQGDMDVSTQTVTFQPGQTTATWRVAVTDDAIYEGNEVFGFDITSASGAEIDRTQGVSQLLGYIIDNDLPTMPTVRFAGPPTTTNVSEGAGYLTHQLVLSAASSQIITVTVTGPGYRQGDMDVSTQTITFQPGQTTATWQVAITDDATYEGNEVFGFDITAANGAEIDRAQGASQFLGYIIDNDAPSPNPTGPSVPGQIFTGGNIPNTITGGLGDDTITGGNDGNYLRGAAGNDLMRGGAGFDDINGNMGNDTLYGGDGVDWVVGGQDQDRIWGDAGDDVLNGNLGDDIVFGGEGADWVRGGQGSDFVSGGAGNDWLAGDKGNDTLEGGAGADVFAFFAGSGTDVITDFSFAAGDRLHVQFGPVVAYTLVSNGIDTTVDFGNGDRITLTGFSPGSIPTSDWLIFI